MENLKNWQLMAIGVRSLLWIGPTNGGPTLLDQISQTNKYTPDYIPNYVVISDGMEDTVVPAALAG